MGGRRKNTADDLDQHYARILAPSAQDERASAALRRAIQLLPMRLLLTPRQRDAVLALLERALRLAEIGGFDLTGTPHQLDVVLAEQLSEQPLGARTAYIALRALAGKTALVERPSRQRWSLRVSALCDPSSPAHRSLVAETPSVHVLAPARGSTDPVSSASAGTDVRELLSRIEELTGELSRERELRKSLEASLSLAEETTKEAVALVQRTEARFVSAQPKDTPGGSERAGGRTLPGLGGSRTRKKRQRKGKPKKR